MPSRTLDDAILNSIEEGRESWERLRELNRQLNPEVETPLLQRSEDEDSVLWAQMIRSANRINARLDTILEPASNPRVEATIATQTIPEGSAVTFVGFDENGNVQVRPATPEQDPEYFAFNGRLVQGSHVHMTTTANPLRDFDYTSNINPYVYYGDNTPRITPLEQPTPRVEPNYTNIVRQRGRNGRNSDGQITYINSWGGQSPKKGLRNIPMFNDLLIDGSNRTKLNSKVRVTYARVDDVVLDLLVKQLKIDETTPVQTEFAF